MTTIHLPVRELQDALARCKPAMSNEETRYYLNGVHVRKIADGAMLQATDGHRLTQVRIKADVPAFEGIILSRDCVASIQKSIKRRHGHHSAALMLGEEKKILLPGNVELPLTLIEGASFPDCDRVVPSLNDKTISTVKTEKFLKCVAAVHGFAKGADHNSLKLTFKGDKLVMSARANDGHAEMSVDCDRGETHDGFEIGFNGQYLTDFARRIDSSQINIHLSDAGSPTRFSGVGPVDEHETFVLMPMRV